MGPATPQQLGIRDRPAVTVCPVWARLGFHIEEDLIYSGGWQHRTLPPPV